MKKKLIALSSFVFGLMPVVALAQITGQLNDCQTYAGMGAAGGTSAAPAVQATTIGLMLCKVSELLNVVVPILLALGVIYFVWGVVSYVIASDEEAKKSGRNRIIYGIIGLAVIVAVWGLVGILLRTFGISGLAQSITLPNTPY